MGPSAGGNSIEGPVAAAEVLGNFLVRFLFFEAPVVDDRDGRRVGPGLLTVGADGIAEPIDCVTTWVGVEAQGGRVSMGRWRASRRESFVQSLTLH